MSEVTPMLIWQGDKLENRLNPIYSGYILQPNWWYSFTVKVLNRHFGKLWEGTEKYLITLAMDSYDKTDPYGTCLYWGAGEDEIQIQIGNTQARKVDTIWNTLLAVLRGRLPNDTITIIQSFEGGPISLKRVEEGRGLTWWEKIGDFFHTLGIQVTENQTWIKTAVVLGGVTFSLYFISTIAKKIPGGKNE